MQNPLRCMICIELFFPQVEAIDSTRETIICTINHYNKATYACAKNTKKLRENLRVCVREGEILK